MRCFLMDDTSKNKPAAFTSPMFFLLRASRVLLRLTSPLNAATLDSCSVYITVPYNFFLSLSLTFKQTH